MSVPYYGDFAEDDTVLLPFNTFDSNDPSESVTITNLADADIKVHKDGGTTPIATDGATIAINYASITGNHLVTIDTSAHADYAIGSEYAVRIEGTTVDGATINAWIGAFSIERAGGALAIAKLIQTAVITNAAGDDVAADIIAIKAETALIVADTGELQVDNIPGTLTAIITDLDDIKGTGFVKDTHSLVDIEGYVDILDDAFSGNLKIGQDVAAIFLDTNELQIDWTNGGRLDLLLDAIPTTAMRGTDNALEPTTAGRKLDVTIGGAAGIDWANVEGKTTVNALTNTSINTVATLTGHTVQTGDTFALANGATGFGAIDTVVDAIKVVTDKMVFTKANELDANTKSINDAEVVGDGNAAPWDGV